MTINFSYKPDDGNDVPYTDRMKEAFASFNERIEVAYQRANPDRPNQQKSAFESSEQAAKKDHDVEAANPASSNNGGEHRL